MKNKLKLIRKVGLSGGLFFLLLASGCVHLVSYYDSLSYKNLTDLKGEAKVFFDSCKINVATGEKSLASIESFVLASSKAYEYEKGKDLNDDTVAQLETIEETILDIKSRYAKNKVETNDCKARSNGEAADVNTGCLTKVYCTAKWKVLETAFDIAIYTEQLKIKESE